MSPRVRPSLPQGGIHACATGYGWCWASSLVTSGHELVGYMYRERPGDDEDSGWRFLAHAYPNDFEAKSSNHGVFDVNIVANYDPNIIPMLDAPVGTAYQWSDERDSYIELEDWDA